jgi:predicted murein hydrolase (TIGR00659 family)
MPHADALRSALLWSAATLALYGAVKALNRRYPSGWSSPVIVVPLLLALVLVASHVRYGTYIAGTHWLVALLAPAIVAFAVPIYAQRAEIRRYWPVLAIAVVVGSATAIVSAMLLSRLLGLDAELRLSLLPRSISTPFAMIVSRQVGGSPNVTAVLVVLTGVVGAAIGEALLVVLPLRHVLSRGALMGMGAHAIGSARALQVDPEVGAMAGLVMVLAGILNVLSAPLIARWCGGG